MVETVQHTHNLGVPCHPQCRRWGMPFYDAVKTACPDCDGSNGGCDTCDGFTPVAGLTLATVHRKWLDLGLPASTWPAYARHAKTV